MAETRSDQIRTRVERAGNTKSRDTMTAGLTEVSILQRPKRESCVLYDHGKAEWEITMTRRSQNPEGLF